jgi:hypothetical protein
MKTFARILLGFLLCFFLILVAQSLAQWSPDPAENLGIAVRPGAQVQPKVRAVADGGCYISWYDDDPAGSPPYGYDVRLQRLDPAGNLMWPADGILIADLGFSWTQDYGLAVDAEGNALLAFLDDRFAPDTQVTATKVDPNGNQVWGPTGLQVTSGSDDKFSPKITATGDGCIVVAWSVNNDVMLQRFDAAGAPQWAPAPLITAPADGFYAVSDLHAGKDGSVIVSWVHSASTGQFLYTNRLSAAGSLLWGAAVPVYDTGALQIGNRPPFVEDGSGGAVFGWYSVWPEYQVWGQRVLSDGTVQFQPGGVPVSTDPTRMRVEARVSFNPSSSETFLFWREEGGGLQGLYGQKLDPSGARQWTDGGKAVIPLGTDAIIDIRNHSVRNGAMAAWVVERATGGVQIMASLLDGDGEFVCPPLRVSSQLFGKSGLDSDLTPGRTLLLVWEDGRHPDSDIYAQNVNIDCSLGPPTAAPPTEVSPRGAVQPLVFSDKVTLVWDDKAQSGSDTFNLYRGSLSDLPLGRFGDCFEGDIPPSTAVDSETPAAGSGFFYIVTGENSGGEGPMGKTSDGTDRMPNIACP